MDNEKFSGATFILLNPSGQMLLQLRDENSKYYPDTWCFPGEGVEGEEEIIETAIRGAKEEYGVDIPKEDCYFVGINPLPHISQKVAVYICKIGNQSPKMNEGREMRWMPMEDVKKVNLGFEQSKMISAIENTLKEIV